MIPRQAQHHRVLQAQHPHGPASRALVDGGARRGRGGRRGAVAACCLVALLAAGVLGAGLTACGGTGEDDAGVLARVNGTPVTQADVDGVRAEARLAGEDDEAQAALDEAIGRELVRQEAERLGLAVDDEAVEARLAAVAARLGGDEALSEALAAARMSAEQLRRGTAYGLLREALRDARFGDLEVSDAAVRAFYRRNVAALFTEPEAARLGSIFVRTRPLAEKLVAEIRAGEAFDRLARQYSRDPEAKTNGGMLGWIAVATLPDPLQAAVAELDTGAVSGPVEGPGGWFVLKLYDRRPEQVTPFADVEDQLRLQLARRKRMRALDRWIEDERGRADVEVLAK